MEQIGLFFIPEIAAYEEIEPALLEVLAVNGLGEEYLTVEEKKTYYSVCFDKSSVIVRIHAGKKPYIAMPVQNSAEAYHKDGYRKIYLTSLDEIAKYQEDIQKSLEYIIDNITKEFDCCHRFEECSNAKACTHPDKRFALSCGYRKNLKAGRIFYGQNRNI